MRTVPAAARAAKLLLVGLGFPALAYVLQKLIWPYIPPSPHLLFYPAVFAAAYAGGTRAGCVASVVSAFALAYGFLPPLGAPFVKTPKDALNLAIFVSVGVVVSVTLGRLREAAARERAARIAADETWAMIAHDLRTPLSSIELGAEQLARRLTRGGGDLERAARVIERSSTQALALLKDAVDAVKLAEGAFTVAPGPCDPRELFARVVEAVTPLAQKAGVRLDTEIATKRAIVCDEPRLAQVLLNLVVNAVRFTSRGGSVSLLAEDHADDVCITVRDTGAGIAAEDLPSIFDKHWSKGGSSGLGLWIARGIVRAHGREIGVASEPGHGTTFSFALAAVADDRAR